jgi:hypothetical protein
MALTGLAHNAVKRSHTPVYDSAVPPMKTLGDRRGDDLGLRGGEGSWWAEMERPAHQAVVFFFKFLFLFFFLFCFLLSFFYS